MHSNENFKDVQATVRSYTTWAMSQLQAEDARDLFQVLGSRKELKKTIGNLDDRCGKLLQRLMLLILAVKITESSRRS